MISSRPPRSFTRIGIQLVIVSTSGTVLSGRLNDVAIQVRAASRFLSADLRLLEPGLAFFIRCSINFKS
jgi:hypothetical protein